MLSGLEVIHETDGAITDKPKATGRVPRRPARAVREHRNPADQILILNKPLGASVKTLQPGRRGVPENPIDGENTDPAFAQSILFAKEPDGRFSRTEYDPRRPVGAHFEPNTTGGIIYGVVHLAQALDRYSPYVIPPFGFTDPSDFAACDVEEPVVGW
jgi:hypothetical protein